MAPRCIEVRATTLDQLIEEVQRDHAPVRLLRNGQAVAELQPLEASAQWRLAPLDDSLKPVISRADALAPVDEEDWPSEARPDATA